MIGYWISLKMGKQTKLSNITYEIMARDYPDTKWVKCVRNILESVGRNDLWLNEEILHPTCNKVGYYTNTERSVHPEVGSIYTNFIKRKNITNILKTH